MCKYLSSPSEVSFCAIFFAEKRDDKGSPGVESSQCEAFGLGWCGAGGRLETDESLVDGETGTMTEGDHFFPGVLRQVLLTKSNEA